MDEINFSVQGRTEDPYLVSFSKNGNNITALCDCRAGQFGNVCKHRVSILQGDAKGVVSDNVDQVKVVADWVAGTDVGAALAGVQKAQEAADEAKQRLKDAKEQLASALED